MVQGIEYDSEGSRSFGNGFARNVVIFGVDNSYHPILIMNYCYVKVQFKALMIALVWQKKQLANQLQSVA